MLALSAMFSRQEVETRLGITALPGLATGISLPRGDPVDPPPRNSGRREREDTPDKLNGLLSLLFDVAIDFCDSEG